MKATTFSYYMKPRCDWTHFFFDLIYDGIEGDIDGKIDSLSMGKSMDASMVCMIRLLWHAYHLASRLQPNSSFIWVIELVLSTFGNCWGHPELVTYSVPTIITFNQVVFSLKTTIDGI
ncbi:unnamed protein product [Ambrosiozyma monospora]|uniref:Unnamed protein product n=1 Tax=Ambrosiozyma monospora TaxID=43982 RepID=A0ACB5T752_AMBMO|nr:unnamed protein product [Ambrosiozyma monospora]